MQEHKLKMIPVKQLRTLKRNPQYLTPKQMESLKGSIERDGFVAPILVRPIDGNAFEIVSGNHRFIDACELEYEKVPCVVADLDDKAAQRLAVNLNTVHGDPNAELLAPFLADCDDDVLAQIHIADDLLKDLLDFDDVLKARLDALMVPDSLDIDSPKTEQRTCKCPTCGKTHVHASETSSSNSDAPGSTSE